MVVVYSGDSERPPLLFPDDPASAPNFDNATLGASEPFLFASDLPSASNYQALSEPILSERWNAPTEENAPFAPEAPFAELRETAEAPPPVESDENAENRPSSAPMTSAIDASAGTSARSKWFVVGTIALVLGATAGLALRSRHASVPRARATVAAPSAHVPARVPEPKTASAPVLQSLPGPSSTASASSSDLDGNEDAPAPLQPEPGGKLVVVNVVPHDAKVVLRGVAQPGPPYVFELRPGQHFAVEVAREGYVTRRAVIDGSAPELTVSLFYDTKAHEAEKNAHPSSKRSATKSSSVNKVQSGL